MRKFGGDYSYRKSQTLFRTVPSSTPYAYGLLFPKIGVRNSRPKTQNCNRYYLRNGLGYVLQTSQEHSQSPSEQKPIKSLLVRDRGRIKGLQKFLETPSYLRNGRSYLSNGPQIWQVHSQGPSEQKPIKNFGKKGVWAYPGTAPLWGTPIISGTGKATKFRFILYAYS